MKNTTQIRIGHLFQQAIVAEGAAAASAGGRGIGFTDVLQVALIVLKLTGHITAAWWIVLSPLWISFVLAFAAAGVAFVVARRNSL